MIIHYFVQYRDLNYLMTNWNINLYFVPYLTSFPKGEKYTVDKLANEFFFTCKRNAMRDTGTNSSLVVVPVSAPTHY